MRRFFGNRPHRLGKLHRELLLAGIPVENVSNWVDINGQPLSGHTANEFHFDVPDNVTDAAILAVVSVHDNIAPDPSELIAQKDETAFAAFRAGYLLGQARLTGVPASSIKSQTTAIIPRMDTIQAANINSLGVASTHIKTISTDLEVLAIAVRDLADQLASSKRVVAVNAGVPDRGDV